MTGTIDVLQEEKNITAIAVKKLRAAVRSEIAKTTDAKSGLALRTSGAGSRFKNRRLQRITMTAPYYIFMQHHGFEGRKSNGVNQRLKGTDVFTKALASANIMESLASEISDLRSEQVLAIIQLPSNGR